MNYDGRGIVERCRIEAEQRRVAAEQRRRKERRAIVLDVLNSVTLLAMMAALLFV